MGAGMDDMPSEASIARRQKLAEAIMGQQQEVKHPLQAVGNAVSQITGAYLQNKATKDLEAVEKRRRQTYADAFMGDGPVDYEALAEKLLKSGDPQLVDKGIELKMSLAEKQAKTKGQKPQIQNFYEPDGSVVQKQWNYETEEWEEVGRGPRFQPRRGRGGGSGGTVDGSGGDAGMDDDGSTGKSTDPSILDKDTIDYMADQYMAGDRSVFTNLGRGKSGARNVVALRKRVAEKAREIDPATGKPRMNARQVASAQAELQGYGAYMRTVEGASARMQTAAQEARNMASDVVATSKAVPRSKYKYINWVGNEFRSATGDPAITQFTAALNSFVNTYARAISPTGQPTVADKEHARDMLNTAMSQGQIEAGLRILDREMQNAIAAPSQSRNQRSDEFYSNNKKGPEAAHGPINPPAAGAKPAAPRQDQLVKGRVYNTPKGPLRWTGTGFIPVK
jgi:hypothetical protein